MTERCYIRIGAGGGDQVLHYGVDRSFKKLPALKERRPQLQVILCVFLSYDGAPDISPLIACNPLISERVYTGDLSTNEMGHHDGIPSFYRYCADHGIALESLEDLPVTFHYPADYTSPYTHVLAQGRPLLLIHPFSNRGVSNDPMQPIAWGNLIRWAYAAGWMPLIFGHPNDQRVKPALYGLLQDLCREGSAVSLFGPGQLIKDKFWLIEWASAGVVLDSMGAHLMNFFRTPMVYLTDPDHFHGYWRSVNGHPDERNMVLWTWWGHTARPERNRAVVAPAQSLAEIGVIVRALEEITHNWVAA
jgi:hypothetical protein